MKKLIALIMVLLSQDIYAQDRTAPGTVACITNEDLNAISLVIAKRDMKTLELILQGDDCFIITPGLPVSIMDVSWSGSQKVRVFTDSGSVVVWVPPGGVDSGEK